MMGSQLCWFGEGTTNFARMLFEHLKQSSLSRLSCFDLFCSFPFIFFFASSLHENA